VVTSVRPASDSFAPTKLLLLRGHFQQVKCASVCLNTDFMNYIVNNRLFVFKSRNLLCLHVLFCSSRICHWKADQWLFGAEIWAGRPCYSFAVFCKSMGISVSDASTLMYCVMMSFSSLLNGWRGVHRLCSIFILFETYCWEFLAIHNTNMALDYDIFPFYLSL